MSGTPPPPPPPPPHSGGSAGLSSQEKRGVASGGLSSQEKRGVAFKDRVQSLESVVQSSYQSVEAQLRNLNATILHGHEKTLELMQEKYKSDVAAVEAQHELKVKEKADALKLAHDCALAEKDKLHLREISVLRAQLAERDKQLAAANKANAECAAQHTADQKRICFLESVKAESERQCRVAKQMLEER